MPLCGTPISRAHYRCTSGSVIMPLCGTPISRAHYGCTQRFAGANFTAGGRELFASWSREADDSVLVKTERERKPGAWMKSRGHRGIFVPYLPLISVLCSPEYSFIVWLGLRQSHAMVNLATSAGSELRHRQPPHFPHFGTQICGRHPLH